MKRQSLFVILLVFAFFLSACNLPLRQIEISAPPISSATPELLATSTSEPVPSPEPSATPPPATETLAAGLFNLEMLKNFTYQIADFNRQVTLSEGSYNDGEVSYKLVEPVAMGDLNGDGLEDAAVVMTIDPGGSGTFYYLIALTDQSGVPVQSGQAYLGDRQIINRLEIAKGRLVVDYVTQSLSDPLCCPSEHHLRSYIMESDLRLASEQVLDSPEAQATPLPDAILIDQPADMATFTNPLQVSGRVSETPPEGTLAWYATDISGTLLDQGEVEVLGQPDGPGTFTFEVTLDPATVGLIQIEVVDAANGILRGRSLVVVVVE